MPEHARVVIIDDDETTRDQLVEFLSREGHTVLAQATSLPAALDLLVKLWQSSAKIDAALIDGNLSKNSVFGTDGAEVAKSFREKFPDKPVISISVTPQKWSDYSEFSLVHGLEVLEQIINEL